jgi:hypothetical protein
MIDVIFTSRGLPPAPTRAGGISNHRITHREQEFSMTTSSPLSRAIALVAATTAASLAHAQPGPPYGFYDDVNKWSWQENVGWFNWAPKPDPLNSGAAYGNVNYLQGYIWSENIGWISLGDGSPGGIDLWGKPAYSNASGADYGVNGTLDGQCLLYGYGWSENAGWINFGPFPSLPFSQRMRCSNVDQPTARYLGYAWSENLGWINFDDSVHYVSYKRVFCDCAADFDRSGGTPDVSDIDAFFSAWLAGDPNADADCSGGTPDVSDIDAFFQQWLAGGC